VLRVVTPGPDLPSDEAGGLSTPPERIGCDAWEPVSLGRQPCLASPPFTPSTRRRPAGHRRALSGGLIGEGEPVRPPRRTRQGVGIAGIAARLDVSAVVGARVPLPGRTADATL